MKENNSDGKLNKKSDNKLDFNPEKNVAHNPGHESTDVLKQMKHEERLKKKEEKKADRIADKERIKAEKKADRAALFKIEDPLGFMRIINIISVVLLIIGLFLGVRYIINGAFLINYNHGNYSPATQEFLQLVNIPEGYLPYYNAGNAYYKLEDYDKAIDSYKSALESHPTEKKECDIRVNLALAMLHKIDFDNLTTEKQKANAIRTLQSARNVLCEKGCADPYGTNGHDPEAEQLKQDIDKMLEELDAEPQPPEESGEEEEQNEGQGESEEKKKSKREKELEEELEEQKQEAMEERQEAQNQADQEQGMTGGGSGSEEGDGGGDFTGKTW
ncbi:MAG: tetratricopeptide repeat protein [Eubacterium sp.]|nr:tetratricopeptide repeat protein [Eubacterium sp.]